MSAYQAFVRIVSSVWWPTRANALQKNKQAANTGMMQKQKHKNPNTPARETPEAHQATIMLIGLG